MKRNTTKHYVLVEFDDDTRQVSVQECCEKLDEIIEKNPEGFEVCNDCIKNLGYSICNFFYEKEEDGTPMSGRNIGHFVLEAIRLKNHFELVELGDC